MTTSEREEVPGPVTIHPVDEPASLAERSAAASTPDPQAAIVEQSPKGQIHVVQPGDNLWTVALRHDVELAAVLRWNEGVNPDRLVAGVRILVPGGAPMAPLAVPGPITPRPASAPSARPWQATGPRVADRRHLWPLPVRGILTRGFSAAHPAIDIAAPRGTRVRAIADGTVAWAGWRNNGGGYVVILEHPDGMTSEYNHNSRVVVAKGDRVAQGDTIALVGSTGNSTGPHLDLRIEMGGRLIDPLDLY